MAYLFAYFVGNGEAGLRVAASHDGLTWTDIADKFLIAPQAGLMRDPFLLVGPDERFHLIWTTNWESQDIGYASSNDLVSWSPQSRLPLMQSVPGTRNCWAPEMTYDTANESFLIYWASTVTGLFRDDTETSESDYNHRMWSTTTKDFKSFNEPEIFFNPGFNVIDITLHRRADGRIRLIGKDERLNPEKKNLFVCEANSLHGPFSAPSEPFTKSWVEGPAAVQIGEWTYVYYDVYREKRYEAKRTRDFVHWEDISDQLQFPPGARHGSIAALSPARFQTIQTAIHQL